MSRTLLYKVLSIAAVLLVCIYGIIGLPKSKDELQANLKKNIRLGLDLRGGSHLVLQVQVQDAFKSDADSTIEGLKESFKKANVEYAGMERNEPATINDAEKIEISIKGVPAIKAGEFRTVINEKYADRWVMTSVNPTDYRLTLKPTAALQLRKDTVIQSMNTIEKKINGLGLSESSVQQRGRSAADAEILVQLPGVDDPGHIKQVLKTAAMLELTEVKDGPFTSREEVLSKNGGVLPLNSKIVRGTGRAGGGNTDTWWLLARSPVVTGRDLRDARPQQGQMGRWETLFVLTQDAAK